MGRSGLVTTAITLIPACKISESTGTANSGVPQKTIREFLLEPCFIGRYFYESRDLINKENAVQMVQFVLHYAREKFGGAVLEFFAVLVIGLHFNFFRTFNDAV